MAPLLHPAWLLLFCFLTYLVCCLLVIETGVSGWIIMALYPPKVGKELSSVQPHWENGGGSVLQGLTETLRFYRKGNEDITWGFSQLPEQVSLTGCGLSIISAWLGRPCWDEEAGVACGGRVALTHPGMFIRSDPVPGIQGDSRRGMEAEMPSL